MRKQIASQSSWFLAAFIIFLIADLIAIAAHFDSARYVTKIGLILPLLLFFIVETRGAGSGLKRWIIFALLFSWAGDCFLLFDKNGGYFFLIGLSMFLIAHLFYIFFFHKIRQAENVRPRVLILLLVVIYYVALIYLLSPYLGDMKVPVRIYGIVISFMLMLAFHMLFINEAKAGLLMAIGAALFIISDSILAINMFYHAFAPAGFIVILTYGAAQLLITLGAVTYILSIGPVK